MSVSLEQSYEYCIALSRRTARNFYYSFLTLPRERFRAMCVLYAFMRVTDDLGDGDQDISLVGTDRVSSAADAGDRPSPEARAQSLIAWRHALKGVLEGAAVEHPVLPAVADMLQRHNLPPKYLEAVISGVEMDLGPVAIDTFASLEKYCYHVAGAVGLACIHVWGFHDPRAIDAAIDCGTAFQLTNILRDLREDALLGRMYLPREDLERFGCSSADFSQGTPPEGFGRLMEFEISRARDYYARAGALFDYLDAPGRPILETMIGIYGGLLDEIERRRFDVLTRRVQLSRWRKLSIAGRAIVRHKFQRLFATSGPP